MTKRVASIKLAGSSLSKKLKTGDKESDDAYLEIDVIEEGGNVSSEPSQVYNVANKSKPFKNAAYSPAKRVKNTKQWITIEKSLDLPIDAVTCKSYRVHARHFFNSLKCIREANLIEQIISLKIPFRLER